MDSVVGQTGDGSLHYLPIPLCVSLCGAPPPGKAFAILREKIGPGHGICLNHHGFSILENCQRSCGGAPSNIARLKRTQVHQSPHILVQVPHGEKAMYIMTLDEGEESTWGKIATRAQFAWRQYGYIDEEGEAPPFYAPLHWQSTQSEPRGDVLKAPHTGPQKVAPPWHHMLPNDPTHTHHLYRFKGLRTAGVP